MARARVHLETPSMRRASAFLEAVRRSRALHRSFVSPPRTRAQYRAYVARLRRPSHDGYLVCLTNGELAGVVNLNEIVRGAFQSAYLGFYAFTPHDGRGHMLDAVGLVVTRAFGRAGLHRLEANIQPRNTRSIGLVEALGFRLEGTSPRYLKVFGAWRDHERWAITREEWRARRGAGAPGRARRRSGGGA